MILFLIGTLVVCTGKAVSDDTCPLEINPPLVVVKYKDPFIANCSSRTNQVWGMGWESPVGGTGLKDGVSSLILNLSSVTVWSLVPKCYTILLNDRQCLKGLPVTIYQMAESVLFQPGRLSPMVEGQKYRMDCHVFNVAPARNLYVYWHRGNKLIFNETFKTQTMLTPVNVTSSYNLTAQRDLDGKQFSCEAHLDFGPSGPNIPKMQSKLHDMIVHYPPSFSTPAQETVTVPAGGKITLNCIALGNPAPAYSWHLPHLTEQRAENDNEDQSNLTISYTHPGTYNCTASNTLGTVTKYFIVTSIPRNYTTLAAIIGVFGSLGVLLAISGLFFMTPEGTFSFRKGSYIAGQQTSGPV